MFRTKYSRIFGPSNPLTTTLPVAPDLEDELSLRTADPSGASLGLPRSKPYFDTADLLAVICSLGCLVVSMSVISPNRDLSWRLGYEGQIVAIGFLLSIMTLCVKKVAPTLFLILEARWGSSTLQNYDAILRNSMMLSHTRLTWRVVLLSLIVLPLGLSAAYKRFTGGKSRVVLGEPAGYYGLTPPPLGNINTMNNSIYLMINANVPFMAASANDTVLPRFADLPKAYGYNTLLLDKNSAAILDMPVPDYITSIQQNLTETESWYLSASVNATVARYNTSGEDYINNDEFWKDTFAMQPDDTGTLAMQPDDTGTLPAFELFNGDDFGLLLGNVSESDGTYCLIGNFPGSTRNIDWWGINTTESDSFRSFAFMFNTRRERCAGTWQITRSAINLLGGSCSSQLTTQDILNSGQPFYLDAMPVLVHSLGQYSESRAQSEWRIPAFATSVATMYWARIAFMNIYQTTGFMSNSEIYYQSTDEIIISENTTLNAHWLLYVVLAVQPLLVVIMFLSATLFYSVPIHKGFGLVAIMSGIDRDSLNMIRGAALSGELAEPVSMDITICHDTLKAQVGHKTGRIEYTLGRERHKIAVLERGKKYS